MESELQAKQEVSAVNSPIHFYLPHDDYGFLSNFYLSQFELGGKIYITNEHYFQSNKFVGLPEQAEVINAKTPREAFDLAKKYKPIRLANWDSIKDDIMYTGLTQKFTVHKDLREKLLDTGNRELIEHTTKDVYWADGGGPGLGLNKLGNLLMRLRQEIRQGKL